MTPAADKFLEKNLLTHPDLPESGVLTAARIQTAKNVWQIEFEDGSTHDDHCRWINEIAVQLEPGNWGRVKHEKTVERHLTTKWANRGESVVLPKGVTAVAQPPTRPGAADPGHTSGKRAKTVQDTLRASARLWRFRTTTSDEVIREVERAAIPEIMASVSEQLKTHGRSKSMPLQQPVASAATASSVINTGTLHAVPFTGSPPAKRKASDPSGSAVDGLNKRQAVFGNIPDSEQPAILLRAMQLHGGLTESIAAVTAITHDDDKLTWLEQKLDAWDGTIEECSLAAQAFDSLTSSARDKSAVRVLTTVLGRAISTGANTGHNSQSKADQPPAGGAINAIIQSQKEVGEAARVPKHLQFTETDIRAVQHTVRSSGHVIPTSPPSTILIPRHSWS
eukprot:SAG11_NODE_1038_length_6076_cov_4.857454_8_plen_394_part_00